ncbi:hypothetical protein BOO71_0002377 [Deinococcus marmoris]|uniref:Calcineurin-like phosphoesterase domain-containing protein n=1 Tax=Deinococcus marmoris TaxID=249408 RepID=A0A1U7P312_9DEIO|nr:hypothetical protein BOO71_0002377 [Deinococcus marmoris]
MALLGNHDLFMVEAVLRGQSRELWIMNGGSTTLAGYEGEPDALEADARWMIASLKPWHVQDGTMFSHAMRPDPTGQDDDAHLWGRPGNTPVYPLPEGVTVSVHGHTPQQQPKRVGLQDGTALWLIDTGAVFWGTLTALDCETWTPHAIT